MVLDPFCGKGTIPLEACLSRRLGLGVDVSPEAASAARAAIRAPTLREVENHIVTSARRVHAIQDAVELDSVPRDVGQFFHPETLREILAWRKTLEGQRSDAAHCVRGLLLGILHGKGRTFLSLRCSHAYSMSPKYVRRYVKDHRLRAEYRNVGQCLLRRARDVLADGPVPIRGRVWEADATDLPMPDGIADLVITSPPYFSVHRYARENWLRLWFLGYEDYREIQRRLIQTADVGRYRRAMQLAFLEMHRVLKDGARAIILVGDVPHRRKNREVQMLPTATFLAEEAENIGFRPEAILIDKIPQSFKVVGYMAPEAGISTERLLILSKT